MLEFIIIKIEMDEMKKNVEEVVELLCVMVYLE